MLAHTPPLGSEGTLALLSNQFLLLLNGASIWQGDRQNALCLHLSMVGRLQFAVSSLCKAGFRLVKHSQRGGVRRLRDERWRLHYRTKELWVQLLATLELPPLHFSLVMAIHGLNID